MSASQRTVDLNADLGEGFGVWQLGDDAAMLELVTSADVACGFHAGDPARLARTCRAAAERGVRIGAQVGYRDLAGFGRRYIDVGLAGSALFDAAAALGLRCVAEAFADRAYLPDGHLVSRREPNAVLHDPDVVAERVATMVTRSEVVAIDGSVIPVVVESVCVHGDSPGAVQMASSVRQRLTAEGVDLKSFM